MTTHELTTEECLDLIASGGVGRVALCMADGPTIYPVNFVVAASSIVFRTAVYSALGTAIVSRPAVAFEVDEIDYENRSAWSVVARGVAEPMGGPEEILELDPTARLMPWVEGSRNLVVRVTWHTLDGRRVGKG